MTWLVFFAFLAQTIKSASVFIFGSTGEIITEKSGSLNMGIPGIMFLGALGGLLGEQIYISWVPTGASLNGFMVILMPLIFSMLFAVAGGLLYAFFTVSLKCNQNVTGLTLTTFGVGLSSFFIGMLNGNRMSEAGLMIQSLFGNQAYWTEHYISKIFFGQSFFTYLSIIIAIIATIILSKTRIGLNLRACGENPAAADATGINVDRYRYLAILIGSAIAGIGGMAYELDLLKGGYNPKDIVDGMGWLCLSLVIFSMWKPSIAIGASFLFGGLQQLRYYLVLTSVEQQIFSLTPYVVTILILILTSVLDSKNAQAPQGLGQTYFREDR